MGTHTGTTVTEAISYDPWGAPSYTGSLSSRVMWKGLMWEGGPATGDVVGLYYVRGRWYDPQAGRFIQEDPLGVDGGINVYTFAGDDPINGSDPSGMDPGAEQCIDLYNYAWVFDDPKGVSIQTVCFGGSGGDGYSTSSFGNDGDGLGHGGEGGAGGGNGDPKPKTKPKSTPAPSLKTRVCSALNNWVPSADGYIGLTASYFLGYGFTGGVGLVSDNTGPGLYIRIGWGLGFEGTGGREMGVVGGSVSGIAGEGEVVTSTRSISASGGSGGVTLGGGTRVPTELPIMGHAAVTYTQKWSLASLCH